MSSFRDEVPVHPVFEEDRLVFRFERPILIVSLRVSSGIIDVWHIYLAELKTMAEVRAAGYATITDLSVEPSRASNAELRCALNEVSYGTVPARYVELTPAAILNKDELYGLIVLGENGYATTRFVIP